MIMHVFKHKENRKKKQKSSIKIAMSKKCLTECIQIRGVRPVHEISGYDFFSAI